MKDADKIIEWLHYVTLSHNILIFALWELPY